MLRSGSDYLQKAFPSAGDQWGGAGASWIGIGIMISPDHNCDVSN